MAQQQLRRTPVRRRQHSRHEPDQAPRRERAHRTDDDLLGRIDRLLGERPGR